MITRFPPRPLLWEIFWLVAAPLVFQAACPRLPAQTLPATAGSDPDWARVVALRQEAAKAPRTRVRGLVAADRVEAARVRAEREARARKFREVAEAARAFHVAHPGDGRAAEARKIELLAALEGLLPSDLARTREVEAAAEAFRANRQHPLADRLEVAQAVDRRAISQRTLGRPWFAHPVLAEAMLDRHRTEFGDHPEVWGGYLSFARNAECDAGREAAYRIVQAGSAPASTKAAAQRLLARYALVRQPLDFPLQPVRGRPTTLAALAGRITIVCVWDGTRQPAGPPGLGVYRQHPPSDTHWVYLSLGELGTPGSPPRPAPAPAGTTCVEPLGWKSPLVAKLQLSQLPYVFVLDEARRLSGYGRIDEIPALIAGIGRPALP